MIQIILSLISIVHGAVIILYPVLSFIFYLKKKCYQRLILFIGLFTVGLGTLIQVLTPVNKMTFDEAGNILSTGNTPLVWYTGSIIFNMGVIISVLGFALIVFKKE
jgi:hypothetical protein